MNYKDVIRYNFKCLDCYYRRFDSEGGGFGISINCKLMNFPLEWANKDKVKSCKNHIIEEDFIRRDKLLKLKKNAKRNENNK